MTESDAYVIPDGVPEDALSPCDTTAPHEAHHYVWGGPDPDHYWCVGVQKPPVHLLNAYTWAGRRGACGLTSEALDAAHDRAEVTCAACLATSPSDE